MDNRFASCAFSEFPRADLDRFTDRVENVLNDDRGRGLFRNFMLEREMRDGLRVLNFWEHVKRLLDSDPGSGSPCTYSREINELLAETNEIAEIDEATMRRLYDLAQDPESSNDTIVEVLVQLKEVSATLLGRAYAEFQTCLLNYRGLD